MRVLDPVYNALLDRLAAGECTNADYELLQSRVIARNPAILTEDKFKKSPIIVPGNELQTELNIMHAKAQGKETKTQILIARSRDTCSSVDLTTIRKEQLWQVISTKGGGLPGKGYLMKGMPVHLTTNYATELCLTNGSLGIITAIVCDRNEPKSTEPIHVLHNLPLYVLVKFEDTKCPQLQDLEPKVIPIHPITSSFKFRFQGTPKQSSISRTQIPLVPAYAYTAYKAQGKTLESTITDLVPSQRVPMNISFAYVPLSRVRRLSDILILRDFPPHVLQQKKTKDHIAQDKRFQQM